MVIVALLGVLGIGSRLFSNTPQIETYEVQQASLAPVVEEPELEPLPDPFEQCQSEVNAALLAYQDAAISLLSEASRGRAQDWRQWAIKRAEKSGNSPSQELRAAFSATTEQLKTYYQKPETVNGQTLQQDSFTINAKVGKVRDLEGSRGDIALALATLPDFPLEAVNTKDLQNAAIAFKDVVSCQSQYGERGTNVAD